VNDVTAENQRAGAGAETAHEWLKVIGGPRPDAPSTSANATPRRRAGD
jgi:hypothetical protein